MTVNEAMSILTKLKNNGKGKLPLQLMVVEQGITYAEDVKIVVADSYDGNRVWVSR